MLPAVPPPARVLGLAGLLPFCVGSLGTVVLDDGEQRAAFDAVIAYGAVILTFLGAVHWGIALQSPQAVTWERLGWSVTPSLLGWVALLIDPEPALVLLVLGLGTAFVVDLRASQAGLLPVWYLTLRFVLSLGAIAALMVSFAVAVL